MAAMLVGHLQAVGHLKCIARRYIKSFGGEFERTPLEPPLPSGLLIRMQTDSRTDVPTGTALTLKAAINALHSVCDKWYKIGVQLEVPIPNLNNIGRNSMDPLCDTLDYWMRNDSSPSWSQIVDAMKSPGVGENQLAKEIEAKYCSPEEQSHYDNSVRAKCHQGMYMHVIVSICTVCM